MKHTSIGILVLALVAALALPAAAQNTPAGDTSPGSTQAPGQPSSADQSRVGSDTPDPNRATTTAAQPDSSIRSEQNQQSTTIETSITNLLKGGEEADRMQFQALDQHLQMLDNSIKQLRQLSSQPEQNAADIMRWSDIRDQHAHGVADVVASYFLEQRLLPPSMPELGFGSASDRAREEAGIAGSQSNATSSTTNNSANASNATAAGTSTASDSARAGQNDPLRQAYLEQLQTAHEVLVRARLVKQSSDPAEVREIRSLVGKLRSNQQQYQRQIEAHLRDMESRGDATEQAARAGQQNTEPGIDQPGERQAARPGEAGSSGVSPNTSNPTPNADGSANNQDSTADAPAQEGSTGSATP
ncbi:MAG: hypothetical protein RBU21_21460 [FCB group bacterium]|jgi:hypothetical protein|nr:hypothetical protein [FCB group bacterium]